MFKFLEKYLMKPMNKMSQFKFVRAIMAAGMASIPFTIVGSLFLVLSVLPVAFPVLKGFFNTTFAHVTNLYMVANTMTMGILALYFAITFAYEYTSIIHTEEKLNVNPLTGALLAIFAFFMTIPELVMKNGTIKLVNVMSGDSKVFNGIRVTTFVDRIGTSGIFTGIIMAVLAVELYRICIKYNWTIKMPEAVPEGIARSFSALIPMFVIAFAVFIINGTLVVMGTDIFKVVYIPFSFVTKMTSTWIGVMVIYFLIHILWIVGIHGAVLISSFILPIVLSNMVANAHGAHYVLAGEFQNCFATLGGSGATLGMCIFIAFFAKSEQLKVLGKASFVPGIFNINEPLIFGLPIVYNLYLVIPFFLAPMVSASLAYFAIHFQLIRPIIAQMPWPSPIGIGAFVSTGGDWKAVIVAILCAVLSFIIWYPFIKFYDRKLLKDEQAKASEATTG